MMAVTENLSAFMGSFETQRETVKSLARMSSTTQRQDHLSALKALTKLAVFVRSRLRIPSSIGSPELLSAEMDIIWWKGSVELHPKIMFMMRERKLSNAMQDTTNRKGNA